MDPQRRVEENVVTKLSHQHQTVRCLVEELADPDQRVQGFLCMCTEEASYNGARVKFEKKQFIEQ